MPKRPYRPRRWFRCPCCNHHVATGHLTCSHCGHGMVGWQLVADLLALAGTRDIGYNQEDKPPTGRGQK